MGFIVIIIIIIPHIWDNIFGTFSERRRCTDHPGAHEKWWLEDKPFLLGPGNFSVAKRWIPGSSKSCIPYING